MTTFASIVDVADALSLDEQEALVDILKQRIASANREKIVDAVAKSRAEYDAALAKTVTVEELMTEIDEDS
ncbi:MAG: hypothetical protein CMJ78_16870 [Planctomycetaceae bacterium]|nr:hypothetical protein [Planctomycetaceae bacterium]